MIWGCSRTRKNFVPFAADAYISAVYWFTASTSFANPAVTIARSLSPIRWHPHRRCAPFILAQLLGALAATLLFRWLTPGLPSTAPDLLLAHPGDQ